MGSADCCGWSLWTCQFDFFTCPKFQGYICQGDAFLAMDHYDAAEKSYATCLEIDPSVRRSKSFKVSFKFLTCCSIR